MQEISVKILKKRIISSNIFVSQNVTPKLEISIEYKAKVKTPKNAEDKSVLLNIGLTIVSKNEELKMELLADFVFGLDQLPDDYNKIAEEKLVPMASEDLLDSLDEILVVMGYNKMQLTKKM